MYKRLQDSKPLYTNTRPIECAASRILRCLAYNKFGVDNQEFIVRGFHEYLVSLIDTSVPRGENDLDFPRSIRSSLNGKIAVVVDAAINLVSGRRISYNPQVTVDGTLTTALYNEIIKYRCNLDNSNKVLHETFLM